MPSLTISLLDAYRGQGIGSQLLDALLGGEHQRIVQEMIDFFGHRLDACGAMAVEAVAGVAEQADGLQQIVGNHRHKHIQLEIA